MDAPIRIDALPRHWAALLPDGPAIRDYSREVTWRTLDALVDECAGMLATGGVRAGDRVMIVAENSPALIVAVYAASRIDATAVIVNPRLSVREVDGIVEHAAPRLILFATGAGAEIDAHAQRFGATPSVAAPGLAVSARNDRCSPDALPANVASRVAAIVYTSGTSGRPKGVMLSHGNLLFVATASARLRRIRSSDHAYGALPIYHCYGLSSVLLGSAVAGACLHTVARFDPRQAVAALARQGLTIFQGVPAMYARMLELPPADGAAAPSLRYLYAGGSPLDPTLKALIEARFGCTLHNGYGLTECSPTVSQTLLDAPRTDTSVGPPIPGIDVRIVAADGEDVVAGGVGELWIRGPNVMQGYYRDAAATAEVITPDGWLKTGDLARRDPDGALFIVGRSKELIIRSGFNVYPVEVETVLNAHPAVSQSVVVGRPAADGNEDVIAFVELAPGHTLVPGELAAHVEAQLAPYKRPTAFHVMAALPASATGKVLRGQLKSMALAAPAHNPG